jgi:hypothetical protein
MSLVMKGSDGSSTFRGEEPAGQAEIFWMRAGTGRPTKTSRAAAARG